MGRSAHRASELAHSAMEQRNREPVCLKGRAGRQEQNGKQISSCMQLPACVTRQPYGERGKRGILISHMEGNRRC